jgi:hypothetical protein
MHERLAELDAEIVRSESRREVVAAIHDQIVLGDETPRDVVPLKSRDDRSHGAQREPSGDGLRKRLDLRVTDIGLAVEHLPGEVRLVDDVVIEHGQPPDARRGKTNGHRTAEATGADDQYGPITQAH